MFFNDTATTEIYTLSLHDALPIFGRDDGALDDEDVEAGFNGGAVVAFHPLGREAGGGDHTLVFYLLDAAEDQLLLRSEEHTSELQSRQYLVCRLLLEKKKTRRYSV